MLLQDVAVGDDAQFVVHLNRTTSLTEVYVDITGATDGGDTLIATFRNLPEITASDILIF